MGSLLFVGLYKLGPSTCPRVAFHKVNQGQTFFTLLHSIFVFATVAFLIELAYIGSNAARSLNAGSPDQIVSHLDRGGTSTTCHIEHVRGHPVIETFSIQK